MAQSLGWIRQFHKPGAADLPPLLIFPHAGSGASTYRAFSKLLSTDFDTAIFQYPGRQDRVREPAAESLHDLAAGAFAEFEQSKFNRGAPVTVFGHSMGSIVAFEFTRLAEAAGLQVRLLVVSASVAPDSVDQLPDHPDDDEALLGHLMTLEGTGDDVLASREVMRMALPVMKIDYKAFDAYTCDGDATVAARIHAIGGTEDPYIKPRDLYGWDRHTSQDVEVTVFDGGHFYLNEYAEDIAELLVPSR